MKKILMQCNTVYQVMVAVKLKIDYYYDDEVDIIISDIMNDYEKIQKKTSESGLFYRVFKQEIKGKELFGKEISFVSKRNKEDLGILNFDIKDKYEIFFCANLTNHNLLLYSFLKVNNKRIMFNLFEDGIATYSNHYGHIFRKAKKIKALFNKKYLINDIKAIYVFDNCFFQWKPSIDLILISKDFSQNVVNVLNYIFEYSNECLPNNCKVIFFEEGFYADGKDVNDLAIISNCINKFGNEGFYVKRHPRNRVNRFENTNIKVLNNSSIPWELFVLNNKDLLKKCILISISSAAIFSPLLIFGITIETYSCLYLINKKEYLFKYIPEIEIEIISKYENINFIEQN